MFEMGEVYTSEEILGEHIYSKVLEITQDNAEKITGMLLECNQNKILEMLQNKPVLISCVTKAQETIAEDVSPHKVDTESICECDNNVGDDIGEKLYEQVLGIVDTELLAAKVTGMLLELESSAVKKLLHSPSKLNLAIDKARTVLLDSQTGEENSQKEMIADQIYSRVELKYDKYAPQITGMLMELEENVLVKLTENVKLLDLRIEEAYSALMPTHS